MYTMESGKHNNVHSETFLYDNVHVIDINVHHIVHECTFIKLLMSVILYTNVYQNVYISLYISLQHIVQIVRIVRIGKTYH